MSDPMRYLFRFRDMVAKTIESHQHVITEKGSCWWGWWKRPSEDNRADIWAALSAATPDQPIPVGLFDSGQELVWRALVTSVVPPNDQGDLIDLPTTSDYELVPSYYRQNSFSRGWMKISEIVKVKTFFNQYSFSAAPKVASYSDKIVYSFKDKLIVSAAELRGMDTTIWEIRPKKKSDHKKEIVLSTRALTEAISKTVVECSSHFILHITDLHFDTRDKSQSQHVWNLETDDADGGGDGTLGHKIFSALPKDVKIGAVIVTGDLTFVGSEEEFNEAYIFLTKLLGQLDLDADHLIVVPGNHDIQWSTDKVYVEGAEVRNAPEEAKKNYKKFYEKMFRHPPSTHLSMGRRWLLPSGLCLEIAALNSSSLETGKSFLAGMGRIQENAFKAVALELGWDDLSDGKHQETAALRILALHHHLAVTEDIEPTAGYSQGYGMAVDAVLIQRLAARHRIQLALHGHKHRVFVWRSSVYDLLEDASTNYKLGEISIVGGGSAGSTETDGPSNYFNLIEVLPGSLRVKIFRSKNRGIFRQMNALRAQLDRSKDGSLELKDWEMETPSLKTGK